MLHLAKLRPGLNRTGSLLAILAALATIGVLLAGSMQAANAGQASTKALPLLTVSSTWLPQHLNPVQSADSNQATPFGTEALMAISPSRGVQPALAVSWKAMTPLHWRFNLRKGVKFWDGKEMTSTDVAFSLNQLRAPGALASRSMPPTIKAVNPVGRYQVDILLSGRDATFLPTLAASGSIFEKAYYEQNTKDYGVPGDPVKVMGTGPYMPRSFDPTTGEELDAHKSYWGGRPRFDHVTIKFFQDETSSALAFRSGQVDLAFPTDPEGWLKTAGSKGLIVDPFPGYIYWMFVNTQMAPWNDVHFRRAVRYAINQSDLRKAFGARFSSPTETAIPAPWLEQLAPKAKVAAFINSLPQYPFDLAKAKAELKKSKYPNGTTATGFLFNGANLPVINQVIKQQLAKIGITYKPKLLPSGAQYGARLNGPKAGIDSFILNAHSWIPDGGFLFHQHLGSWNQRVGGQNWSNWAPPEIDPLLKSALAEMNPLKRFAIYSKIVRKMQTDQPIIPLFSSHPLVALSSKYTFKYPSLIHLWPDTVWLNFVVPKS